MNETARKMIEAVEEMHREAEKRLIKSQQARKREVAICFDLGWEMAIFQVRDRLRAIANEDQK